MVTRDLCDCVLSCCEASEQFGIDNGNLDGIEDDVMEDPAAEGITTDMDCEQYKKCCCDEDDEGAVVPLVPDDPTQAPDPQVLGYSDGFWIFAPAPMSSDSEEEEEDDDLAEHPEDDPCLDENGNVCEDEDDPSNVEEQEGPIDPGDIDPDACYDEAGEIIPCEEPEDGPIGGGEDVDSQEPPCKRQRPDGTCECLVGDPGCDSDAENYIEQDDEQPDDNEDEQPDDNEDGQPDDNEDGQPDDNEDGQPDGGYEDEDPNIEGTQYHWTSEGGWIDSTCRDLEGNVVPCDDPACVSGRCTTPTPEEEASEEPEEEEGVPAQDQEVPVVPGVPPEEVIDPGGGIEDGSCEQILLNLINTRRVALGQPALIYSRTLWNAAKFLAEDMAETGVASHFDSTYTAALGDRAHIARAQAHGWPADNNMLVENVHYIPNGTAAQAFEGWMNSPLHRDNIEGVGQYKQGYNRGAVICHDGAFVFIAGKKFFDEPDEPEEPDENVEDIEILETVPLDEGEVSFMDIKDETEDDGNGGKTCIVADCSFSMIGARWNRVKAEIVRTVASLPPGGKVKIFLFQGDFYNLPNTTYPNSLAWLSSGETTGLTSWLQTRNACGGTFPKLALRRAFRNNPSVIYLLSDGEFTHDPSIPNGIPEYINTLNQGMVHVNTVYLGSATDVTAIADSRSIARSNYGIFKHVPIPLDPRVVDGAQSNCS